MAPILAVLLVAIAIGLLLGGRLRRFDDVRLHWWGLAIAGLLLQAVPTPTVPGVSARLSAAAFLVVSYGLLLVFLGVNRWVPAAPLMAVGLALNLTVVAANAGMPVSPEAIERAGGPAEAVVSAGGTKHHLMTEEDVLTPLGDVIPLPQPIGIVVSIGDIALYLGMAWFVVQIMRGRSRENPRPLALWPLAYRGSHAPAHWRLPARRRATRRAGAAPPGSEPR